MRAARIAAALVILAGGLWLWSRQARETAPPEVSANSPASEAPASTPANAPEPAPTDPESVSRSSAPIETTEATSPATSTARGTIVVLDERGAEHATESGTLTLMLPSEPGTAVASFELAVTGGAWDPATIPASGGRITRVQLGGRTAILEGDRAPLVAANESLSLRARWIAGTVLHVVDADSGAELDGVSLMRMTEMWSADLLIPTETSDATSITGGPFASPIALTPEQLDDHGQGVRLFARTSRHAWGAIPVDRAAGGDLFLKLVPGGHLRVEWSGGVPSADQSLRLWRIAGDARSPIVDRPMVGGIRTATDAVLGLTVGDYEARLEKGSGGSANVLAKVPFSIVAGQTTKVALEVPAAPPDQFASVVVVVRMDDSWGLEKFNVWITDLALPQSSQTRQQHVGGTRFKQREPGVFASKPVRLRVAKHQFYVSEAGWGIYCDVTAAEPQEIVLDLPACCRVRITAVDAATGAPLDQPSVSHSFRGNSTSGGHGSSPPLVTGVGPAELRVPPGPIDLFVRAGPMEAYWPGSAHVVATPGVQDVRVPLERARTFTVVLREGERPVDCTTATMSSKLRDAGGRVVVMNTSLQAGKLTCSVQHAGLYTLELPTLPGFQPIPEQPLDLTSDKTFDLVIQLVRESR